MILKMTTIVFLCGFLIVAAGCDGDNSDNVERWEWTNFTDFGRRAVWSPDGSMVLFGDDTPGRPGLYLWSITDTPRELDEALPPHNWDYTWSPSGTRIAFTSPGAADDSLAGVWIYDFENQDLNRIYHSGCNVTWDSSEVAVAARLDNVPGYLPGIYRIEWTGNYEDISASLVVEDGYKPSYSPCSPYMAYTDSEIRSRLYVIDENAEVVFSSSPGVVQWTWSRNSPNLSCVINDYNSGIAEGVLWRIDMTDPANPDSLTRWVEFSAISSDGQQVAFTRVSSSRYAGLWLYRSQNEILKLADFGLEPSFDPIRDRLSIHSTAGGIRILTRAP